jgi:integrase
VSSGAHQIFFLHTENPAFLKGYGFAPNIDFYRGFRSYPKMPGEPNRSDQVKSWLSGFAEEPVLRVETPAHFEKLCDAVAQAKGDALQLLDLIKVMAYGGALEKEALELKWADVDWERKQLIIGSDRIHSGTKPTKPRFVDFNPKLEGHLKHMHSLKPSDAVWLFPSSESSSGHIPAGSFNHTLKQVRKAAGFPQFDFQNLRLVFQAYCMDWGVPTLTRAAWMLDRYD